MFWNRYEEENKNYIDYEKKYFDLKAKYLDLELKNKKLEVELQQVKPIIESGKLEPAVSMYCADCRYCVRSPWNNAILGCCKNSVCEDFSKENNNANR